MTQKCAEEGTQHPSCYQHLPLAATHPQEFDEGGVRVLEKIKSHGTSKSAKHQYAGKAVWSQLSH